MSKYQRVFTVFYVIMVILDCLANGYMSAMGLAIDMIVALLCGVLIAKDMEAQL